MSFLIWGITFFELISLSRFKHILDSLINCFVGISICVEVFVIRICDFCHFFFFVSVNALSNWFARFCKLMIL